MATNIARLNVDFIARTGRFSGGVKKMRAEMTTFSKTAQVANRTISKFGSSLLGIAAGVASVSALVSQLKQASAEIDKLAKTSDKLGTNFQRFQALTVAGELTGVDPRQFATGLQRMTRRIAEAAKGSGEARGALRELGLEAKRLVGFSPDQQFLAVARAMVQVSNQSDRVRLGFKLFDAEGVGLVNTLALGDEGLRKIEDRMRSTGQLLSRFDAARVEQMNDSITRARVAWDSLVRGVLIEIAPMIQRTAQRMESFITRTSGGVQQLGRDFRALFETIEGMGVGLGIAIGAINDRLNGVRIDLLNWLRLGAETMAMFIPYVGDSQRAFARELQREIDELSGKFDTATRDQGEFRLAVSRTNGEIEKLIDNAGGAQDRIDGMTEIIEKFRTARSERESAASSYRASIQTPYKALREFERQRGLMVKQGLLTEQEANLIERNLRKAMVNPWQKLADEREQERKREAEREVEAQKRLSKRLLETTKDRAKSIAESLRTPIEVYRDTVGELKSLNAGGFLGDSNLMRGMRQAAEDLLEARRDLAPDLQANQVRFARTAFGPNVAGLNGSQSDRVRERQLNSIDATLKNIERKGGALAVAG